jgi:hypothetical protein
MLLASFFSLRSPPPSSGSKLHHQLYYRFNEHIDIFMDAINIIVELLGASEAEDREERTKEGLRTRNESNQCAL